MAGGGGGGDQLVTSSDGSAGGRRAGFDVLRQRSANRTSRAISPNRDTCRQPDEPVVIDHVAEWQQRRDFGRGTGGQGTWWPVSTLERAERHWTCNEKAMPQFQCEIKPNFMTCKIGQLLLLRGFIW